MRRIWTAIPLTCLLLAVACGGASDDGGSAAPAAPPQTNAPAAAAPPAANDAPAPAGTASISGSVRYDGPVPKLPPLKMDADPGCAKKHSEEVLPEVLVLGAGNALANVIVYVKSGVPAGTYAAPAQPAVLDQHGCRYSPHVITVQTGQPFKVLNSDGLLHNVHGLPELNTAFNRAMPAAVTEVEYVFDKEEIFKVKCDVHPWMGAYVGVFAHPFHGVTGTDGRFSLAGLPAGNYEIAAVHERLGTLTAQVTVADGAAGSHDFTFSKPN